MFKTSTLLNLQIFLRRIKGFNFKSKRTHCTLHHVEPCVVLFIKKKKTQDFMDKINFLLVSYPLALGQF
jgi:hypothetical protein